MEPDHASWLIDVGTQPSDVDMIAKEGMESAIKTTKLTKYYGKTRGIEDLDLEIRGGEVFGNLGPNGAGSLGARVYWLP